jgi:nucleoside-diphosphate-sugar epimerase
MAHLRPAQGFLFASTISVYDPPGGDTPVPESHPYGIHTTSAYSFTKVANEAVISYLSRSLDIPTTIIRVGGASGVDGGPMRDRLDRLVQGKPIRLHPDRPTYARPLFEPDCARLGIAALQAGRVPPLVVNWCGDDIVTVEDYCSYLGELIGRAQTLLGAAALPWEPDEKGHNMWGISVLQDTGRVDERLKAGGESGRGIKLEREIGEARRGERPDLPRQRPHA